MCSGESAKDPKKAEVKRERKQRFKLVGNENSFQLMVQEKPNIHILKKKKTLKRIHIMDFL